PCLQCAAQLSGSITSQGVPRNQVGDHRPMKTKAEADAIMAKLALRVPVVVTDVTTDGAPRREFLFNNPEGLGFMTVEIDADPTPQQLADLARNLPVRADK